MPRYLIERNLPRQPDVGVDEMLAGSASSEVMWLFSFVSADGSRSFDVYESPTPEALRRTSDQSGLPLERITEVCTLDPHPFVRTYPSTQEEESV